MKTKNLILRGIAWIGAILLQLVATQLVTFLASLFFTSMEAVRDNQPWLFIILVGLSFSTGSFAAGMVALRWLHGAPLILPRLVATLVWTFMPFVVVLFIREALLPGSPLFLAAMIGSVVGFHLPGWLARPNAG